MNKPKRTVQGPVRERKQQARATVVDLAEAREHHRRRRSERRVREVLEDNRAALSRLFATGLIFTQKGSRTGRDLLAAHHALLKVIDLVARAEESEAGFGTLERKSADLFHALEAQLVRTAQLTVRTGEFISGRGRE